MKKYVSQIANIMASVILIVSIFFSAFELIGKAADCTVSVTADKTTVNIGEAFNVTVSVSGSDVGVVSGSLSISGGASTGNTRVYLYKTHTSETYTFQATEAGTVNISVTVDNALFFTTELPMTCDVGGCAVTIVEPTTAPPPTEPPTTEPPPTEPPTTEPPTTEPPTTEPPTTEPPTQPSTQAPTEPPTQPPTEPPTTQEPTTAEPTTEALSNNAYLEALSVYPGELSPAFTPEKRIYDVTVGYEVEKISVSVATQDVDATYIVTDTNLKVGLNYVDIKVTAADGTIRWYGLHVVREAAETTKETTEEVTTEEETSAESTEGTTGETETEEPVDPLEVVIGTATAYVQETLGDVERPEGFEETTVELNGVEVEALKGLGNKLILLSVSNDVDVNLYIYNESNGGLYPYVGIQITSALYTVLPFDSEEQIPEGYKLTVIDFGGKLIDAWVKTDAANNNFALFYAMNWEGTTHLYRYDAEENTLQRVNKDELIPTPTEPESLQESEPESSTAPGNTNASQGGSVSDEYIAYYEEQLQRVNRRDTIMFIIMVILLLCLIAMYLLFASGRKDDPEDPDNDPDNDLEDEENNSDDDSDEEDAFDDEFDDEFDDPFDGESESDIASAGVESDGIEASGTSDDAEQLQKELEEIQLGMAGIVAGFEQDGLTEQEDVLPESESQSEEDEAEYATAEETGTEEVGAEDVETEETEAVARETACQAVEDGETDSDESERHDVEGIGFVKAEPGEVDLEELDFEEVDLEAEFAVEPEPKLTEDPEIDDLEMDDLDLEDLEL